MADRHFNILFLCIGNAAWSPMAEALLNRNGRGVFQGYSAGIRPAEAVDPLVISQLRASRLPTEGYLPKSWLEFVAPGSPPLDFVFSACHPPTEGIHPDWPGHPTTALWGIADPALTGGSEREREQVILRTFMQLQTRILLFLALPLEKLSIHRLQGDPYQKGRSLAPTLPSGHH